jgi:hypothetical protein
MTISGYGIDKIAVLIPILLLVAGIIMLAYRTRDGRKPN